MNQVIIPIKAGRKQRAKIKGRTPEPKALKEVQALLGAEPRRRDLLIEHLHKIQDRYARLSAPHLVALAAEMKMAMAEVYEVATFYHHFDVVKEGDAAPCAIRFAQPGCRERRPAALRSSSSPRVALPRPRAART